MGKHARLLETIPNLLLSFFFAACMLITLLTGARIYQNISAVMEEQYSLTTSVNYMAAKVRHYDRAGGLEVGSFDGVDALILNDTYDGEKYKTYLYCDEGYLMELFCSADMEFSKSDGQQIMALDHLELQKNKEYLSFSLAVGEKTSGLTILLQSGEVADENDSAL